MKRIFKFELVNPECLDDIVLNLEMTKTTTADVYKLFGIFVNKQGEKPIYIKKRIAFAYIPTYILSIKCKLYFLNKINIENIVNFELCPIFCFFTSYSIYSEYSVLQNIRFHRIFGFSRIFGRIIG